MNRVPQHKSAQYIRCGVAVREIAPHSTNHPPITYDHQDDYYIFGLIESGTACGMIDFKELHLAQNDVFIVQPGQMHRFIAAEGIKGWLLMVDCSYVDSDEKCILDHLLLSASAFKIENTERNDLCGLASILAHRLNSNKGMSIGIGTQRMAEAFVSVVAEQAQKFTLQTKHSHRHTEIMLQLRNLLAQHIAENHQPAFYASQLNISTVYLNEIVRKLTGLSTSSYIKNEIVLLAKRMLARTDLSVKQIANQLGFEDWAYFTRLFTQATSITPTAFRSKYLE